MATHSEKKMNPSLENATPPSRVVTREEIKASIEERIPNAPPEMKQMTEDALYKIIVLHKTRMEAMGVTKAEIEKAYREAYNNFQGGKYDEAIKLFRMLEIVDPGNYRYAFAIGAALQYQKKYIPAAGSYIEASKLDRMNPIPRYHLYDCFLKANQPFAALWAITEAVLLADKDPKYAALKVKAEMEKNHLTNLISEINLENEKANSPKEKGDGV